MGGEIQLLDKPLLKCNVRRDQLEALVKAGSYSIGLG